MEQNDYLIISEDGKTVIGYQKGIEGAVVVPHGVTKIASSAFRYNFELTSIYIPDSVTEIGDRAFLSSNSIESIYIPDSVTEIGEFAFCECICLRSIKIPSSVSKIGDGAFYGCSSLKEIIVDENNQNYCSKDGVLYSKDMKTLKAVPANKYSIDIPECVTMIEKDALYLCRLSSIKIPDGVTAIGDRAFFFCTRLSSIEIPESVREIGVCAFSFCNSIKEIHFKHKTPVVFSCAFSIANRTNVTIYVPKGSRKAYRNNGYYEGYKIKEEKE